MLAQRCSLCEAGSIDRIIIWLVKARSVQGPACRAHRAWLGTKLAKVGAKLGPSWGQVGAKLDQVGRSWNQVGTKLEPSWVQVR